MDTKFQDSINWNVRDELKGSSLAHIHEQRRALPYAIGMININGELNIGMSMRSAEILGAEAFWIIGKRRYDKRSTVGGQNYIPVHKIDYDSHEIVFEQINTYYEPIFIETSGPGIIMHKVNSICARAIKPPMFVFGSESEGIPAELLNIRPENVFSIRQFGVLRSLNVSAAVSIIADRYSDYLVGE